MGQRREFHLVQDFIPDGAFSSRSEQRPKRPLLTMPDGVAYLSADDSRELQITATPTERPDRSQFVLESFCSGQQPQLLLICPAGERVSVNGRPAPQLCLLVERDQLQFDEDHILHVAVYNRPDIGLPGADRVGADCPVCRTKIEADASVYSCLNCGTAIHLQGEEVSLEARLECALAISECPVCQQKIEMSAAYSWTPELYHA